MNNGKNTVSQITDVAGMTGQQALAALAKGGEIEVAGRSIDAKLFYDRFREAIEIVERKLGHLFGKLDLNEILFQCLPGAMVGEATAEGIKLEPILLLHRVSRLVMALVHELMHAKKKVMSEGLVDAMVEIYFPGGVEGSAYDSQDVVKFAEGARLKIKDLWEMYRDGKFRAIYKAYEKACGDGNKAIEEMRRVFPELTFTEQPETGWTKMRPKFKGVAGVVQDIDDQVAITV